MRDIKIKRDQFKRIFQENWDSNPDEALKKVREGGKFGEFMLPKTGAENGDKLVVYWDGTRHQTFLRTYDKPRTRMTVKAEYGI